MRKQKLIFLLFILSLTVFGEKIKIDRSVEESITKDYDQDGVYSSYEKVLRRAQELVYVKLPEKRSYWYTILDRLKAEEEELMPEEINRMRRR